MDNKFTSWYNFVLKKETPRETSAFHVSKSASIKTVTLLCVSSSLLQFLCSVHFSTLFQYLGSGNVSNEWKKKKLNKNKHSETGTKDYLTVRIFAIVVKYHEDHEDNHEDSHELSLVL